MLSDNILFYFLLIVRCTDIALSVQNVSFVLYCYL